ncbi:MAG TPA: diguanylate cyclase [Mobilitalea sp.]|nr:diguanylate cyclase [Mobilitalea sp.]
MYMIEYMQSRPTLLLTAVLSIVGICIIAMIVFMLLRLESERKVTKAALELKKITNSVRAGLLHFILEDNCRILYASKGFFELMGYNKNDLKEQNKVSLYDFILPRDLSGFKEHLNQLAGDTVNSEIRMGTKEGKSIYVLMNGNVTVNRDGKHTISAVFVDISDQKKMQETILLEGERYRIAAELSNDILFEYHIQTDQMIYSEKYKEIYGTNPVVSGYIKKSEQRRDLIHPDDWGVYLEYCQELSEGRSMIEAVFRIRDRVGEYIWSQLMGKTIYDDDKKPIRVIGKMVNIDIQKRELEALEYKATRDPLTGIYNKEITIKKIEKYIYGNRNSKHMLMFIDFDDFKKVNDSYGHLVGDKVLAYVTGRIREEFSEGEIIGRMGGDEFIVFAGNITDVTEVLKKADNLVKTLNTVYTDQGCTIPISGSIGISVYPKDGMHYEQLLERADKALYQVKEQGKNSYMLYDSAIHENLPQENVNI